MIIDAAMRVDAAHLTSGAESARAAEALGFQGIWTQETQHNPFFPLVQAATATSRIQLGTAVAIAFARSPMVTAQLAWDLQAMSQGRLLLGLGTQVKAHIERRFGMPWSAPVARMREYVQSLRAIWACWQDGAPLAFQGQFYTHTLMTPFFNPGPIAHPHIPVYIAGVNEGLARLAGECCDGFHVHPFHSVEYIRQLVQPQVAAGAAAAGRDPRDIALVSSVFLITGSEEERAQQREQVRQQIAFYASTPTYRVVLACHGWEATGAELSRLASAKQWAAMPALISDAMLDVFAVEAAPAELGRVLAARYTGVLDRIAPYAPFVPGASDELWRSVIGEVQRGQ